MHDDVHLTEGRVSRVLKERLWPAVHTTAAPVSVEWHELPGEPIAPSDGLALTYVPFEVGSDWGPAWGTAWFRIIGTVPTEWAGKRVELVCDLGFDVNMPGFQCEGLVYTPDGEPIKSLNPRNQWVLAALGVLGRAYNSGSLDGVPGVARVVELVIHTDTRELAGTGLASLGNTRGLASIERLEQWATTSGTVVKPIIVVDLAEDIEAAGYVPTTRQRRQAALIHQKCSFPYCQARAEHCDLDHRAAYAAGGRTSSQNLTPLCRQHHRMKTHHGWRYHRIRAGTYRWRSPHGYEYVVSPAGTVDVSNDLDPPLTLAA